MVRSLFRVSPKSRSLVLSFGTRELVAVIEYLSSSIRAAHHGIDLKYSNSLVDVPEQFIMFM